MTDLEHAREHEELVWAAYQSACEVSQGYADKAKEIGPAYPPALGDAWDRALDACERLEKQHDQAQAHYWELYEAGGED